tara:strand:- start:116 stop:946 length:831 start_codon:yes stop_codon:yes gene_type:complete
MRVVFYFSLSFSICFTSCGNDRYISLVKDPNFLIVSHNDKGFRGFNRKVVVFGIPIYAKRRVEDCRLLHAANIMAQYLDNDEDGKVDNEAVLKAMLEANAFMVMWKSQSDLFFLSPPDGMEGQDLGNDETIIDWHANGQDGQFDASLEEVLHIITHAGYANAYPDVFGESQGSSLCNAMDLARAGQFLKIPNQYPDKAWYHYDDTTCEYDCMATEYIYWALTSLLGAQSKRGGEIGNEWELHTPELVEETDIDVFQLLTNEEYSFPKVLPDGKYMQ